MRFVVRYPLWGLRSTSMPDGYADRCRKPCVDLTFVPFESFIYGHLYVMLDSTYFVRRVVMNFPQKINLNFVDYMKIEQNFDRAEDGTRQLYE